MLMYVLVSSAFTNCEQLQNSSCYTDFTWSIDGVALDRVAINIHPRSAYLYKANS